MLEIVSKVEQKAFKQIGMPQNIDPETKVGASQLKQRDMIQDEVNETLRELRSELSMPATLLLGKEPQLFTEADRLKSEAQLRLAIVPPLFAIILYVSSQVSWWALIALLPVVILLVQGTRRFDEFELLMLDSFRRGVVESQAIIGFNEWVERIPTEGLEPSRAGLPDYLRNLPTGRIESVKRRARP